MKTVTRPLLRYHGGKWLLGPWIIGHFPSHRVYTEAFGGGASVLLQKERSHAEVYNDLDGEIVNVFRVVRDRSVELLELLELTPFARADFDEAFHPAADQVEQARRTILRSLAGFGSNMTARNRDGSLARPGFRCTAKRSGTTPARDWRNYPGKLPALIDRLRGVVIECRPASEVLLQHDEPGALHYVDPPYLPETRDVGSDYTHEMTPDDHVRLLELLHVLRGNVIVSGYPSRLYDEHLIGWTRVDRRALADGARPRVECLWLSPRIPRGLFNTTN